MVCSCGTSPSDNTPAKKAGLQPGDVIITADGQPVDRVSTLQRIVRNHNPGETIELEAMRYGQRKTFRVTLMEAKTDEVASAAVPAPAGATRNATPGARNLGRTGESGDRGAGEADVAGTRSNGV